MNFCPVTLKFVSIVLLRLALTDHNTLHVPPPQCPSVSMWHYLMKYMSFPEPLLVCLSPHRLLSLRVYLSFCSSHLPLCSQGKHPTDSDSLPWFLKIDLVNNPSLDTFPSICLVTLNVTLHPTAWLRLLSFLALITSSATHCISTSDGLTRFSNQNTHNQLL